MLNSHNIMEEEKKQSHYSNVKTSDQQNTDDVSPIINKKKRKFKEIN